MFQMLINVASIIVAIICVYSLISLYFSNMKAQGLEDSIRDQKNFHETKILRLNEKMKEGFDTKSKALGRSEELRLKVISELEEKKFHFEKLERDLKTTHKLYSELSGSKDVLETKYTSLKDQYNSIKNSVEILESYKNEYPKIPKKLRQQISEAFSELQ